MDATTKRKRTLKHPVKSSTLGILPAATPEQLAKYAALNSWMTKGTK